MFKIVTVVVNIQIDSQIPKNNTKLPETILEI